MKKRKLSNKSLHLSKSRIAELNAAKVTGGGESTQPHCIFTGPLTGCVVSANCPGETNNCGTNNCDTNDPTCNTQAILSCLFSC